MLRVYHTTIMVSSPIPTIFIQRTAIPSAARLSDAMLVIHRLSTACIHRLLTGYTQVYRCLADSPTPCLNLITSYNVPSVNLSVLPNCIPSIDLHHTPRQYADLSISLTTISSGRLVYPRTLLDAMERYGGCVRTTADCARADVTADASISFSGDPPPGSPGVLSGLSDGGRVDMHGDVPVSGRLVHRGGVEGVGILSGCLCARLVGEEDLRDKDSRFSDLSSPPAPLTNSGSR